MTEEKIIMYDSPEAAQQKQLTLWVASDGRAKFETISLQPLGRLAR
jgi:hypothetical protein